MFRPLGAVGQQTRRPATAARPLSVLFACAQVHQMSPYTAKGHSSATHSFPSRVTAHITVAAMPLSGPAAGTAPVALFTRSHTANTCRRPCASPTDIIAREASAPYIIVTSGAAAADGGRRAPAECAQKAGAGRVRAAPAPAPRRLMHMQAEAAPPRHGLVSHPAPPSIFAYLSFIKLLRSDRSGDEQGARSESPLATSFCSP
ncbi:hypothetical protein EVAR_299_1 [Eumeta japonica]|uniref:Uncharacterized protein n=1 Tax=Eumeta variegata TaxID=151549 RepID=A0A4C1SCC7_EUMVA|nr:hypothetical protein EVAR_299_1 [Eumeta japonica]